MQILAYIFYTFTALLALVGILALLAIFLFRRTVRKQVAEAMADEAVQEEASWFGSTGLDEETERELPRYLRREFGERLSDEGALKADDLDYLGAFDEDGLRVHYWLVPSRSDERHFAYVEVTPDGETCTGWGDRAPPPGGDDGRAPKPRSAETIIESPASVGLGDALVAGKIAWSVRKALQQQRTSAEEVRALPMDEFIAQCLAWLNECGGQWHATARAPAAQATGESRLRLPAELHEFYLHCDGFAPGTDDFPAPIMPAHELQGGIDYSPPLSERIRNYWKRNGNDSEVEGMLGIFPPNNLAALASNSFEIMVPVGLLDSLTPLCPPKDDVFVAVLTEANDHLPVGTVLEIEGGTATRYDGFRHWLSSYASLFGNLPKPPARQTT